MSCNTGYFYPVPKPLGVAVTDASKHNMWSFLKPEEHKEGNKCSPWMPIFGILLLFIIGSFVVWLIARQVMKNSEAKLEEARNRIDNLATARGGLNTNTNTNGNIQPRTSTQVVVIPPSTIETAFRQPTTFVTSGPSSLPVSTYEQPKTDVYHELARQYQSPVKFATAPMVRYYKQTGNPVIVAYYADWCGACKSVMPEFIKAARNTNVPFLAVSDKEVPQEEKIKGFPTIKIYNQGSESEITEKTESGLSAIARAVSSDVSRVESRVKDYIDTPRGGMDTSRGGMDTSRGRDEPGVYGKTNPYYKPATNITTGGIQPDNRASQYAQDDGSAMGDFSSAFDDSKMSDRLSSIF